MAQSTLHRLCYRDVALRSLDQLPPFSPVLHHLLASLADDDAPLRRLADLLERDTVLAGNVLRLVNSAAYGRRAAVNNVRHAISILGFNRLRNFLLGVSVTRLWVKVKTAPGWSMARFNQHSTAVAVLADLLVQRAPVDYAEGAFAAGLLHDLGRLVIAVALPNEHERILDLFTRAGAAWDDAEMETLDLTQGEIGAAALRKWNLPLPIQHAVGQRRPLEAAPAPHRKIGLGAAVAAASLLADHWGCAVYPIETDRSPDPDSLLAGFALAGRLDQLLDDFHREHESFRAGA